MAHEGAVSLHWSPSCIVSDTCPRHLVSAGALVIALGFMVEPFLQAVISDYG